MACAPCGRRSGSGPSATTTRACGSSPSAIRGPSSSLTRPTPSSARRWAAGTAGVAGSTTSRPAPEVRRSGLATRLITEVETRLAGLGARRVDLLVREGNDSRGGLLALPGLRGDERDAVRQGPRPAARRHRHGGRLGRDRARVHPAHARDARRRRRSTTPTGCSRSSGTASASRRWSTADGAAVDPRRAGRGRAVLRAVPRAADVDRRHGARSSTARSSPSTRTGEPDFALLQARIKGRAAAAEPTPFVYEVFDLLHLDGQSLLDEPLEERRRLLAGVLRPDPRVRLSEHIESRRASPSSRRHGCAASRGSWPRTAARRTCPASATDRWQKIKIRPGAGARRRWLGDGDRQGGRPRRAARRRPRGRRRCATRARSAPGSRRQPGRAAGRRRAAGGRRRRRSTTPPPRAAATDAHWLRPELVIRAEFAGWTGDGLVRQAAYKGIELEKDPQKVIRERPKA